MKYESSFKDLNHDRRLLWVEESPRGAKINIGGTGLKFTAELSNDDLKEVGGDVDASSGVLS